MNNDPRALDKFMFTYVMKNDPHAHMSFQDLTRHLIYKIRTLRLPKCHTPPNLQNEDSETSMLTRHIICKMKTLARPHAHDSHTPQLLNSLTPQTHNSISPQLHNSPTPHSTPTHPNIHTSHTCILLEIAGKNPSA